MIHGYVETGWVSTFGVLLNLQCATCRVWIGLDEKGRPMEFDGMPHPCPKLKAPEPIPEPEPEPQCDLFGSSTHVDSSGEYACIG